MQESNAITASLNLDVSAAMQALRQFEAYADTNVKAVLKGLADTFGELFSLDRAASRYLKEADAAGKLSSALGENIGQLQAWANAVTASGGSADTFYTSLKAVSKWAASGGDGQLRTGTDLLFELAQQADTMDAFQFTQMAEKLGLDSATIALLQQGSARVGELIARQKELGTYTGEDAAVAAQAKASMNDLSQSFQMAASSIFRVLLPPLTQIADALTGFFTLLRKHQPFVMTALAGVAALVTATFVPALLSMAGAAASAMLPLLPFIAVIGVVAGVIDDLFSYMDGQESTLSAFWELFGTPEEVKAGFTELKAVIGQVFDALSTMAPFLALVGVSLLAVFSPVTAIILAIAAGAFLLIANWKAVKQWFSDFADAIKEKIDLVGQKLQWLSDIGEAIGNFFDGFGPSGQPVAPKPVDAMSTAAVGAANTKNIQANSTVTVNEVNVVTQATDANGIAKDMRGSVSNYLADMTGLVSSAEGGVNL